MLSGNSGPGVWLKYGRALFRAARGDVEGVVKPPALGHGKSASGQQNG